MGKKSGCGREKKGEESAKAGAFLLKVAMHCHYNRCISKICVVVKDITLLPGVEAVAQLALERKGKVKMVAMEDPEMIWPRRMGEPAAHGRWRWSVL